MTSLFDISIFKYTKRLLHEINFLKAPPPRII